jgi:ATP synthase protein I
MSDSAGLFGSHASSPETEATVLSLASAMLRPALWSAVVVGFLSVLAGFIWAGADGAVGSAVGTLLVIGCCWLTIAIMRWTASAPPMIVMAAGIGGYCAKFLILLVVLIVLRDTTLFDVMALGISILATVSVWTIAELIGFVRARVFTVTPNP